MHQGAPAANSNKQRSSWPSEPRGGEVAGWEDERTKERWQERKKERKKGWEEGGGAGLREDVALGRTCSQQAAI